MKDNKPLGIIIIILSLGLFIPSYMHYNYKHFIKLSKAILIYEHNKNYNLKMSFPDQTIYKIFNSSVSKNINQITFSELTLANKNNNIKLNLLGDKPYFFQLEKKGLNQNVLSYVYGNAELRSFFLQSIKRDSLKLNSNEVFMYHVVFMPYVPSILGHLRIQGKNNEYMISSGEMLITADITTNEKGLISSISTTKYKAYYSDYKNEKGIQIPTKLTLNDNVYRLKKIKMNILNTHR